MRHEHFDKMNLTSSHSLLFKVIRKLFKMERKYDCGVYQIRNLVNDRVYVGQSIHLSARKSHHFSDLKYNKHGNRHLQNAYNLYGKDNFVFEIVLYCEDFELTRYENAIKHLHENNCYNIRICADSNKGLEVSEETRRKLSQSAHQPKGELSPSFGRKHTKEEREAISNAQWGKKFGIELSIKRSKLMIGKRFVQGKNKYIGVYPSFNKWFAKISFMMHRYFLGMFDTEEEAAEAYNKKAIEFMGDKAILNIIESPVHSITYYKYDTKSASKYNGVSKRDGKKPWRVTFSYEGEKFHLGSYETEIEAAMAFNEAAIEFYGYNAKINLIPQEEIDKLWEME
jgi:group I intron endonuclease